MSFLAMGGYAWYVWMAYGAVAVVIAAETIALRRRGRRALAVARMVQQTEGAGVSRTTGARASSADPTRRLR